MNPSFLQHQLATNQGLFTHVFAAFSPDMITWRPYPEHWSALEVLCHLVDEEREDFRTRVMFSLEQPMDPPPPIAPRAWVKERNNQAQNWAATVAEWGGERELCLTILQEVDTVHWERAVFTPEGQVTRSALGYLTSWVAHDLLHLRQLTRLRYLWLKEQGFSIAYAGDW
ncbi:MAG: DinB family protein [Bacteroidota bacterium]